MRKFVFLAFLFLIPSLAHAIDPAMQYQFIEDFSGGLNTQKAPGELNLNESPNAQNGWIDEKPNSIVKRNGFVVAGSTSTLSKINFMAQFVKDSGSKYLFVSDSSQVLRTTDFMNWFVIKSTLTISARIRAAQGRSKMFFVNGADPAFLADDTSVTPLDGNNGNANVPIGKFIIYYQERFWVLNTTDNCSSLHFMAVASTDGFAVGVTDPRAWPVTNVLNIGQGDGACISGADIYRGRMQIHKDNRSIYTLFGTDEQTYNASQPTISGTGSSSQESLAQIDNIDYSFTRDGVIAFDGWNTQRVSDNILPDMQAVASNLTNIVPISWQTASDFTNNGTLIGATFTASNFVQIITTQEVNNISGISPNYITFDGVGDGTSTPWIPITTQAVNMGGNYTGSIGKISWLTQNLGNLTGPTNVTFRFVDLNTNQQIVGTKNYPTASNPSDLGGNNLYLPSTFYVTMNEILGSSVEVKIEVDTSGWTSGNCKISSVALLGNGEITVYNTTASFFSQVSTAASAITLWDAFTSVNATNGGANTFFIKGATSPVNITTQPFSAIVPGNIIPLSASKTDVVWSTTMTAISTAASPTINNVFVNYNEGGTGDQNPIGIEWKKRYWLAVTTTPGSTNTIIYVKSKNTFQNPMSWTKFTGINIKSMAKFGSNFYAGSSTAGIIFQLDAGTNDNGSPVNWFYETPDLSLSAPGGHGDPIDYLIKQQYSFLVDVDVSQSGFNLSLDSQSNGNGYKNTLKIPLTLSRQVLQVKLNPSGPASLGKWFRYKFSNSDLDVPITFNGFGVLFKPQGAFN